MKNQFHSAILSACCLLIASCGGTTEQKPVEQTTAPSELMTDAPAYDASKIDPTAATQVIELKAIGNTMADISYSDTDLVVKAGTTIKLKFENLSKDASMMHNFTLIEEGSAKKVSSEGVLAGPDKGFIPNLKEVLVSTKMLGPGESTEITFPAPVAGNYEFICTYPGHSVRMHGKFRVEGVS